MSILESSIAPYLIMTAGAAVLLAFFRRWFIRIIIVLLAETVFFVLYPQIMVKFVDLVSYLRASLG